MRGRVVKFPVATVLFSFGLCLIVSADDDARFKEWLQNSRAVFEKHHLIAYLKVESTGNPGRPGSRLSV
jgi:hypothetical protein